MNRQSVLFLTLLSSLFTVYGCAEGKLATQSGRPEIYIDGIEPKAVIEGIAAWTAVEGYQIDGTSDFMIKTKRPKLDFLGMQTTTWITTTYTVVKKGDGTKVYAQDIEHVLADLKTGSTGTTGGFGSDHGSTEIKTTTTMTPAQDKPLKSQSDYEEIQAKLEKIRSFILGK